MKNRRYDFEFQFSDCDVARPDFAHRQVSGSNVYILNRVKIILHVNMKMLFHWCVKLYQSSLHEPFNHKF